MRKLFLWMTLAAVLWVGKEHSYALEPAANEPARLSQRVGLVLCGSNRDSIEPGPLGFDRFEYAAYDDVRIYATLRQGELPPRVYLFSPSSELDAAVKKLGLKNVRIYRSHLDNWSKLLADLQSDLAISARSAVLARVARSQLKGARSPREKVQAISKFVGVDISILGHGRRPSDKALPQQVTAVDAGFGLSVAGSGETKVLGRSCMVQLHSLLPDAFFRAVIIACYGSGVAQAMQPPGGRWAFIANSDGDTASVSLETHSPLGWTALMRPVHWQERDAPNPGNLLRLKESIYDAFTGVASGGGQVMRVMDTEIGGVRFRAPAAWSLRDNIDAMTYSANPYAEYAKTSVDYAAEQLLRGLALEGTPEGAFCQSILRAGFVRQINLAATGDPAAEWSTLLEKARRVALAKAETFIWAEAPPDPTLGKQRIAAELSYIDNVLTEGAKSRIGNHEVLRGFWRAQRPTFADRPELLAQWDEVRACFEPETESYIGRVLYAPSEASDEKLVRVWGHMAMLASHVGKEFSRIRGKERLTQREMRYSSDILESTHDICDYFTDAVRHYIQQRSTALKREAFALQEIRVQVALGLLERRVRLSQQIEPAHTEAVKRLESLKTQIRYVENPP